MAQLTWILVSAPYLLWQCVHFVNGANDVQSPRSIDLNGVSAATVLAPPSDMMTAGIDMDMEREFSRVAVFGSCQNIVDYVNAYPEIATHSLPPTVRNYVQEAFSRAAEEKNSACVLQLANFFDFLQVNEADAASSNYQASPAEKPADPLHRAIVQNEFDAVRQMLDGGTDLKMQDVNGRIALSYAAGAHVSFDIFKLVFDRMQAQNLDVTVPDSHNFTPLFYAIMSFSRDKVLLFAKHDARPHARSEVMPTHMDSEANTLPNEKFQRSRKFSAEQLALELAIEHSAYEIADLLVLNIAGGAESRRIFGWPAELSEKEKSIIIGGVNSWARPYESGWHSLVLLEAYIALNGIESLNGNDFLPAINDNANIDCYDDVTEFNGRYTFAQELLQRYGIELPVACSSAYIQDCDYDCQNVHDNQSVNDEADEDLEGRSVYDSDDTNNSDHESAPESSSNGNEMEYDEIGRSHQSDTESAENAPSLPEMCDGMHRDFELALKFGSCLTILEFLTTYPETPSYDMPPEMKTHLRVMRSKAMKAGNSYCAKELVKNFGFLEEYGDEWIGDSSFAGMQPTITGFNDLTEEMRQWLFYIKTDNVVEMETLVSENYELIHSKYDCQLPDGRVGHQFGIHIAARHNSVGAVKFLYMRDPDVLSYFDQLGQTPYLIALQEGRDRVVEFIESLCSREELLTAGPLALHNAVSFNQQKIVTYLSESIPYLTMVNGKGRSALSIAAEAKIPFDLFKQILDQMRANNLDVNLPDSMGRTPLWYTIMGGCEDKFLLLANEKNYHKRVSNEIKVTRASGKIEWLRTDLYVGIKYSDIQSGNLEPNMLVARSAMELALDLEKYRMAELLVAHSVVGVPFRYCTRLFNNLPEKMKHRIIHGDYTGDCQVRPGVVSWKSPLLLEAAILTHGAEAFSFSQWELRESGLLSSELSHRNELMLSVLRRYDFVVPTPN